MRKLPRNIRLRRSVSPLSASIRQFFQRCPQYNRIIWVWDLDDTLYDQARKAAMPGAVEVVNLLAKHGIRQCIYSMGTLQTRLERMQLAGLQRDLFFDVIALPWPEKTPAAWQRHIAPYQADGAFVVYAGDSWVHDVAVGLGRADAVIYVQGNRRPGVMGTPQDPEAFPVWIVRTVAEIPAILPALLADPYRGQSKEMYLDHFAEARAQWEASRPKPETGKIELHWTLPDHKNVPPPWEADTVQTDFLAAEWPRTEWDRKDAEWARDTDDLVMLSAWENGYICGCGEELITRAERQDGCCAFCRITGKRTPRPLTRI